MSALALSLDGTWGARMCDPGVGEAADWHLDGFEAELDAQVPGHVQQDLIRAGLKPDFNWDRNAEQFTELEGKDWWLCREFEVAGGADRSELTFGGIDTVADAWLNGVHLGRHENAHVAWTVDVTEHLREGANRLVVRADDGSRWMAGREIQRYIGIGLPDEDNPRMWLRKPQYVWQWTFAPRLIGCGIWRGVELRRYDAVALRDVQLTTSLAPDGTAIVEATCELEAFGDPGETTVELTLARAGREHAAATTVTPAPGRQQARLRLEVDAPALWWPAPLGEPSLYDCTVTATAAGGSDGRRFRHGLRTVRLDQGDIGEEGQAFNLVVNDVPVFCKGSSWHPPEQLFGCVTEEKLRRLVEMAAEANFNMLRVNGVGTYESDLFYDLCAEHGILVWQDFPFACAYYPDDDEGFRAAVKEEAEIAVRRLRNHAAIALWCGNNENQWHHFRAQDPNEELRGEPAAWLYGERIYHEILPEACARLDPDRPYWPGSPWSGEGQPPASDLAGDRHVWDYQFLRSPEDSMHYEDYELDRSKFVSEFGVTGPSDLTVLERILPEERRVPGSDGWQFHSDLVDLGMIRRAIEYNWSPADAVGLEDYLALGQLFQGEALASAIQHWRRRKLLTGGVVSWGFADCWGTTETWSVIDYWLRPHAAYFHLARAFEPLQVSLQRQGDAFLAWVVNDLLDSPRASLELGFVDLIDGRLLSETTTVQVAANAAAVASRLELPTLVRKAPNRYVAYALLRVGDEVVSRARASLVGFELKRLRFPEPRVEVTRADGKVELRAETYAFQVHLAFEGSGVPSDNWLDLLPGETRTISLPAGLDGPVTCWAYMDARQQPGRVRVADV